MSIAARFGESPDEDRGYEEIAKGVMQLWRFHARARAQIALVRLATETKLLILTLDEWFAGRSTIIPKILERAHKRQRTDCLLGEPVQEAGNLLRIRIAG